MNLDPLPPVVSRRSIFEEVAWELVARLEVRLELARNALSPHHELAVIEHCRDELGRLARRGL